MKKSINKKVMRMIIALGVFALSGCDNYGIDSQPSAGPNIQDDAQMSYEMAAESAPGIMFNISANTPWRIESSEQWCTVTPSMSAVGGLVSEVTVKVEDNPDYTPRTAEVTIKGVELDFVKRISIVQSSKTDFIVTEFSGTVPAEGGVATYYIHTNKRWEYFAEDDFLFDAADVTSGEDVDEVADYTVNITVPVNGGVRRQCRFLIRTAAGDYEYSFPQNGITLELAEGQGVSDLTFTSESNAYEAGATVTFTVNANIEFVPVVAEQDADWLEIDTYDATTVTVKTKGGVNPYAAFRVGTINLTAGEVDPVPVKVYQPSAFVNKWPAGDAETTTKHYIDNLDQSVTFYFSNTANETDLALVSSLKLSMGKKWVCEIDPEQTNIAKVRLFCQIDQTGAANTSSFTNGVSHLTLTPDIGTTTGIGKNNFYNHGGGTWMNVMNPWHLDGAAANSAYDGELFDSNDIKKLERIVFEMREEGLKLIVTANGKEISYTRLLEWTAETNRTNFTNKYKEVQLIPAFGMINNSGPVDLTGEYVTVTKCYIADIE
ncbi:MAG: BACON domain-containing protein [Alistipes sp.]|nr:BACON domain-containing protein [Alistipes sp.]